MKLAFSTLGCPDFDWSDIYSLAKDFGFDGIELRGLGDQIFSIHAKPFQADVLPKTVEYLNRMHLEIPCLSSGCCIKYRETAQNTLQELLEYIELASKLHTPYIRILGDLHAAPEGDVDDEVVLSALGALIPYAEEKGVTLLVETNGVYSDTRRLCELLNQIPSDAVAAFMGYAPYIPLRWRIA